MHRELTLEEKATNHETWEHIYQVQTLLLQLMANLSARVLTHDQSKLCSPEVTTFTEFTPRLAGLTYGSDEYKQCLKDMGPALEHHYAHNRHHPEHFEDGIEGMDLVDLLEMLVDWKASSMRHEDGDIYKSLEINAERFSISPQLVNILRNTAKLLE